MPRMDEAVKTFAKRLLSELYRQVEHPFIWGKPDRRPWLDQIDSRSPVQALKNEIYRGQWPDILFRAKNSQPELIPIDYFYPKVAPIKSELYRGAWPDSVASKPDRKPWLDQIDVFIKKSVAITNMLSDEIRGPVFVPFRAQQFDEDYPRFQTAIPIEVYNVVAQPYLVPFKSRPDLMEIDRFTPKFSPTLSELYRSPSPDILFRQQIVHPELIFPETPWFISRVPPPPGGHAERYISLSHKMGLTVS